MWSALLHCWWTELLNLHGCHFIYTENPYRHLGALKCNGLCLIQTSIETLTCPQFLHHGLVHAEAQMSDVLQALVGLKFEGMNRMSDGKVQGTKLNLVPNNNPATQRVDGAATAPAASVHCSTPIVPNNPSDLHDYGQPQMCKLVWDDTQTLVNLGVFAHSIKLLSAHLNAQMFSNSAPQSTVLFDQPLCSWDSYSSKGRPCQCPIYFSLS